MTAPAPGPLAEEAARLVEALSEWARTHTGDIPGAVGAHLGSTSQFGASTECRLCPFCQAIALLRQARPETFQHLLEASTALTAALRSVIETHGGAQGGRSGVERINLDDDVQFEDGLQFDDDLPMDAP